VLLRAHMTSHTCAGCNSGSQRGQTHQHRPTVAEQLLCAQEQQIAAHCTIHLSKLQGSTQRAGWGKARTAKERGCNCYWEVQLPVEGCQTLLVKTATVRCCCCCWLHA
jgi:hypothetical protein